MNAYNILEDKACRDGIDIVQHEFKSEGIKGLCCDNTIAISSKIKITAEKACALAEEMGHFETSVGNIIDLSDA